MPLVARRLHRKHFDKPLFRATISPVKPLPLATLLALMPLTMLAQERSENGSYTFSLRAPAAREVKLNGQWSKESIPLVRGEKDEWAIKLESVPAGVWEYSFDVDGLNVMDARNPASKPQRSPAKSILHVASNPPAAWDWQDVPHGTIHTHGYVAKAAGKPREVIVYTPPGYERDAAKKYPLLILQHGSGDNQRTWVEHGKAHWIFDNLIAAGKVRPMIVMMIDGHPLGMVSREAPEARRATAMEAFSRELLDDALPLVESTYRVEKDRTQHAIAGLSMGGGQALTVGLGNLDRFAYVGAFSAGSASPEVMQKLLADPASANEKLRLLWIAVGRDDRLRQRSEDCVAALKGKDIRHEWQLSEGDHSWPVWRRYLTEFAPLLFQGS
jgi:enterochelin esterase-like enzyme